jgi:CRP-like cAMP-binding protein
MAEVMRMSPDLPAVITIEALRSVPLFASLDDAAVQTLRGLLTMREVPAETELFHQGETGDAMYLILSGRVRISIRDTEGKDILLAELARGDFFGEIALLDGRSRSADAVVLEKARLAVLARDNFLSFVRSNSDVALDMLSAIAERLRRTDIVLRQRVSRNANEEEAKRLTVSDRLADGLAEFGGSWKFIMT